MIEIEIYSYSICSRSMFLSSFHFDINDIIIIIFCCCCCCWTCLSFLSLFKNKRYCPKIPLANDFVCSTCSVWLIGGVIEATTRLNNIFNIFVYRCQSLWNGKEEEEEKQHNNKHICFLFVCKHLHSCRTGSKCSNICCWC